MGGRMRRAAGEPRRCERGELKRSFEGVQQHLTDGLVEGHAGHQVHEPFDLLRQGLVRCPGALLLRLALIIRGFALFEERVEVLHALMSGME